MCEKRVDAHARLSLRCSPRSFHMDQLIQQRGPPEGMGEVPVPLFPSKNGLVPQKQNLDFLCSLFPKIASVPLFPLFLGLCSPDPLKKMPLFPCSPKPLGGPQQKLQDCACLETSQVSLHIRVFALCFMSKAKDPRLFGWTAKARSDSRIRSVIRIFDGYTSFCRFC